MNICIVGVGYVGLVTGVSLSEVGHKVYCVDTDENKIKLLNTSECPIYEKDLGLLLKKNIKRKMIEFSTNHKNCFELAEVIVIAIGTPENCDGSANLEFLNSVVVQIAENVKKDVLVVLKSTVPVGTSDNVEKLINKNLKYNVKIEVASNPEFLAQGTAVSDTFNAARIVIGVNSVGSEKILRKMYEPFNRPIVVTDRKSAEMIKYASNDFLALKISFMNDIANLCEIVGANIEDVAVGMSYDERIGSKFLKAGVGYGGSCFPKDTKALRWLACDHNYELKTVKAAIEVNEKQKMKLVMKATEVIGCFRNKKIAILGVTYKPGTDDIREAPSIPNITYLLENGANLHIYDPVGLENIIKLFGDKIKCTNIMEHAIKDAELVFIFTEWEEITKLSFEQYKKLMKTPIIFDGRNCYNKESADQFNVQYYSIGR